MENPWNVHSIYDLQYFNCPSCIFKNNSKQEFINHACELHPESVTYLENIIDNSLADVVCPWNNHFVDVNMQIDEPNYDQYDIDDSKEGIKNLEYEIIEDVHENKRNIQKALKAYKCDFCNKAFTSEETFINHMTNFHEQEQLTTNIVHEEVKDYKCEICGKGFSKLAGLNSHMRMVHEINCELHQCDHCERAFKQSGDLKKHFKEVHLKIRDNKCNRCPKAFARSHQLKKHIAEVHEGQRNHACGICGKCFSQSSSLKTHIKNIHEFGSNSTKAQKAQKIQTEQVKKPPRPQIYRESFSCEHCDSNFATKEKLNEHIDKFHDPSLKHKCQCGKSYISAEKLESHVRLQHGGAENGEKHICNYCGKVLSRADKLRCHLLKFHEINVYPRQLQKTALMNSVQKNKIHQCKECDYFTVRMGDLNRHNALQHGVTHKCKDCDYQTPRLSDLDRHCVSQHGATPKKLNKCKYCDENFTKPGLLKAHILRVHEEESAASNKTDSFEIAKNVQTDQNELTKSGQKKIHKCKDCDYSTPRISDLNRHCVNMHGATPKKLNKCKYCDENFSMPGLLKSHILRVHEVESATLNIPDDLNEKIIENIKIEQVTEEIFYSDESLAKTNLRKTSVDIKQEPI